MSSSVQVAETEVGAWQRVIGPPPLKEIFFTRSCVRNPTQLLSGEKKGCQAPYVPVIGVISKLSISLR